MAQSAQVRREDVAQIAVRLLFACRNGEAGHLERELELARALTAQGHSGCTLEAERLEVLSGVVDALSVARQTSRRRVEPSGAVRVLEHLAKACAIRETSSVN